jgi:hypothetical protein
MKSHLASHRKCQPVGVRWMRSLAFILFFVGYAGLALTNNYIFLLCMFGPFIYWGAKDRLFKETKSKNTV